MNSTLGILATIILGTNISKVCATKNLKKFPKTPQSIPQVHLETRTCTRVTTLNKSISNTETRLHPIAINTSQLLIPFFHKTIRTVFSRNKFPPLPPDIKMIQQFLSRQSVSSFFARSSPSYDILVYFSAGTANCAVIYRHRESAIVFR